MEYEIITIPDITVVGIKKTGLTLNDIPSSAKKIADVWATFVENEYLNLIPNKMVDDILAIYTGYTTSKQYSFILGAEVTSYDKVPESMISFMIPTGKYAVFSVPSASSVADFWKKFWSKPFKFERTFVADYERYPSDGGPVTIHIGIK